MENLPSIEEARKVGIVQVIKEQLPDLDDEEIRHRVIHYIIKNYKQQIMEVINKYPEENQVFLKIVCIGDTFYIKYKNNTLEILENECEENDIINFSI